MNMWITYGIIAVILIIAELVYVGDQMISVYALDPDADNYCKNLIDEKTHLIGINGLDTVSEVIGDDYDRLYRLYLELKRGK